MESGIVDLKQWIELLCVLISFSQFLGHQGKDTIPSAHILHKNTYLAHHITFFAFSVLQKLRIYHYGFSLIRLLVLIFIRVATINTREGQKVPATICFLFTWVHLYKGGSVYINYEHLSFMPCNMDSVARLVALRH